MDDKKYLNFSVEEEILGQIEITGVLYSSKNSRNVGMVGGKIINFGNPQFNKSLPGVLSQLKTQYKGKEIHGAINLHAKMWVKNETWYWQWVKQVKTSIAPFIQDLNNKKFSYSGTDTDNKLTSVFEYLKKSHVIHDDCQFIDCYVGKRFGKGLNGDYGATITLTRHEYNERDYNFV